MSDNDPLFSANQHALDKEFHTCPKCGSELLMKSGKKGPFLGCASYPDCDYTRPLHAEAESFQQQIIPDSECPECGHELAVKHGRYGMFIGCSNFPDCHHIEQQEEEKKVSAPCPSCNKGELHEKQNRFGKTFYACDQYPKCKYAVNYEPVAGECNECGYPLLLKRNMAAGEKLQCANKKCGKFQ
ncbi:topoisomerase DNA-binding C4 zinc finger domain-containing protein [Catenovulum sp. SM1970]|uniref:DNA topoisomerase family protein n=1 Tax=Marinifaba aquimaris TaxID=2741323 RepID=UPI00157403F8|nr:topoisomerase DNA-binding C4 zinc finger domain-containing protein [Marinifaba aquimaris]NTS78650.1 topoisomerase DNA-binding C4 zinc finger domain-containing protein [Marinifaba aquimaris]